MTSLNSISLFSWHRWIMLWQYYLPQLKRQLISYPLASLALSLCLLLPLSGPKQLTIYTRVYIALSWMLAFAPIVFAKFGDSRIIDRLIPALPLEKLLFYLVYLLIAVPLMIMVFPFLSTVIYLHWPAIQTPDMIRALNLRMGIMHFNVLMNLTGNASIILTCFYFVMTSRRNRLLKGIIGAFVAYVVLSVIGGVMGYYFGISYVTEHFNMGMTNEQEKEFIDRMITEFTTASPATVLMAAIEIGYIALLIYLLYRWLKRGNL